jgi:hypothetical protein
MVQKATNRYKSKNLFMYANILKIIKGKENKIAFY